MASIMERLREAPTQEKATYRWTCTLMTPYLGLGWANNQSLGSCRLFTSGCDCTGYFVQFFLQILIFCQVHNDNGLRCYSNSSADQMWDKGKPLLAGLSITSYRVTRRLREEKISNWFFSVCNNLC